jgi:hypothetical protein
MKVKESIFILPNAFPWMRKEPIAIRATLGE